MVGVWCMVLGAGVDRLFPMRGAVRTMTTAGGVIRTIIGSGNMEGDYGPSGIYP